VDGRLDEVAYRRLAERLVAGSGLLACGTTGEKAAAILGHARADVRLPFTRLDADDPAERTILDALVSALARLGGHPETL